MQANIGLKAKHSEAQNHAKTASKAESGIPKDTSSPKTVQLLNIKIHIVVILLDCFQDFHFALVVWVGYKV